MFVSHPVTLSGVDVRPSPLVPRPLAEVRSRKESEFDEKLKINKQIVMNLKKTVKVSSDKKASTAPDKELQFAFGKENYRLMLIGLGVIALGFILMVGGGSKDPQVFNEAIFNFQRLTLAPLLILAGYVIEIFAIMKKPRD
jgi:hypothetical protein